MHPFQAIDFIPNWSYLMVVAMVVIMFDALMFNAESYGGWNGSSVVAIENHVPVLGSLPLKATSIDSVLIFCFLNVPQP